MINADFFEAKAVDKAGNGSKQVHAFVGKSAGYHGKRQLDRYGYHQVFTEQRPEGLAIVKTTALPRSDRARKQATTKI